MRVRSSAVGMCASVGVLVFASSALAAGLPVRVPDNPLAPGNPACQALVLRSMNAGSTNYPDAEVEPYVAADPTDPSHLIASVQQDRWNDGGSNGLTNTVSFNGGGTWRLAQGQPAFSICEGATQGSSGFFDRATDPWVSFSADGKTAYSISDSFNANGPAFGGASSIIISRSTDGGLHWQTPVTARLDTSNTVLNDKESVTADPLSANKAYAAWDRLVAPNTNANPSAFVHSPAFRGPAMFSSTSDSGMHWSNGRAIFDPGQNQQTIGNVIVVPKAGPATGVLFDGFDLINNKRPKFPHTITTYSVAMIHSGDGGSTWSGPTIVAQQQFAQVFISGRYIRTSDELPEFATGPEGNLYAVWQDGRFTTAGTPKIAFSMSSDGGAHWSTPIRIDQSPGSVQAFTPQITVRADGAVAVQYYDLENATTAQPGLTDQFLVSCPAAADCTNPASWAAGGERSLSTSGSFDMLTAPVAVGPFVGDYTGLTTTAGGLFESAFAMASPIAQTGPTDLFANSTP